MLNLLLKKARSSHSEAINAAMKKAYAGKSRTHLRWLMKEEGIAETEMLKTFYDMLGYNRK